MEKIDMFQERFVKVSDFGWWDMDRIQTDDGTQFTSKEFHEGCSVSVVQLTLDVFQPKTVCLLSFSGMYRKLFLDCKNRNNLR